MSRPLNIEVKLNTSATCLCGNTTLSVISSSCTTKCAANSTQSCGGSNAATVFSTTIQTQANPYLVPDTLGSFGCWALSLPSLVPVASVTGNNVTRTMCKSACAAGRYRIAGVADGSRCYCGASMNGTTDAHRVLDTECSLACSGNKTEKCGGTSRMSVFLSGF